MVHEPCLKPLTTARKDAAIPDTFKPVILATLLIKRLDVNPIFSLEADLNRFPAPPQARKHPPVGPHKHAVEMRNGIC